MRVMIFIDWYKPGFKAGGPIKSISNIVSQLNKKIEFYIVTSNKDYLENDPYSSVTSNSWNQIDNAHVIYLSKANTSKRTINEIIDEINPDTVYCNSLYSIKFSLIPIYLAKRKGIKVVLAVRGMLSKGSLSVKRTKKRAFLLVIKCIGLLKEVMFHATSNQELKDIETHFGKKASFIVAPNLPENSKIDFQRKEKEVGSVKLIFLGRIAQEKNVHFAIEAIANCTQKVQLDVYGAVYDKEYFSSCFSKVNGLPSNVKVEYKGVVAPSKLNELLSKYHVIYLPSTGENFGHSIIEGMMNSCIPVISNKTPWLDLESIQAGFDIDLSKKDDFKKAIDNIALLNKDNFNANSRESYLYAKNIVDNKANKEIYLEMFR